MWKQIRSYLRVLSFALYVVFSFPFYLIIKGILKLIGFSYERWRNVYMRHLSYVTCFIFNIQVEIKGPRPKAPFFLVCNHLSYLDILPLFIALDGTFVAKKEIRSWPVLGYMVKHMGVVFVNRKRRSDVLRVNKILTSAMHKNQGVIIFPEGTSSSGEKVLPLRSSLLQYPSTRNIEVHAASLYYRTGKDDIPAVDSICFFGGRHSFTEHFLRMAKNNSIYCELRFSPETVVESDRKLLTQKLQHQIESIFTPSSAPDSLSVNPAKNLSTERNL